MRFAVHEKAGTRTLEVDIRDVVVAGWTGRDGAAVAAHIAELAALGVKPPAVTPCYYRASRDRLMQAEEIQVIGPDSSGEAEFVLLAAAGALFVGVGSDHTDRQVETYNVTVSKQMCPKPVGYELWHLDDVLDHWDALVLCSFSTRNGKRRLYQEGSVAEMKHPQELLAGYGDFAPGSLMYCGTLATRGGIECGERFEAALEDPRRGRRLQVSYTIETLPNIG